jgi:hypothetical protein
MVCCSNKMSASIFLQGSDGLLASQVPEKWMGRDEPITWPPRSPDHIHLDFFFWGRIRDGVYVAPLATSLPELSGSARVAAATVTLDLLNNMWTEGMAAGLLRCPYCTSRVS